MTRIERVLTELSELYEFYVRIQERKWRQVNAQPRAEPNEPLKKSLQKKP